jgi:hypothetical protein
VTAGVFVPALKFCVQVCPAFVSLIVPDWPTQKLTAAQLPPVAAVTVVAGVLTHFKAKSVAAVGELVKISTWG